jgi:DNA polymerase-3 subunit chi
MARVDFYVLSQAGEQARRVFACRLAEKAYRLENKVHIEAGDKSAAERLDELLWTFRDGSFVPHHVLGTEDIDSPVTIGCGEHDVTDRDLLINLCDEIPAIAADFARIAELVTADDECRQASRRRFVAYREQGHTLETHDV